MNKLIGVYGGTFDVFTAGHWQSIKKACTIFDHLYIVVATAPNKSPMFDSETRVEMVVDAIPIKYRDAENPRVTVCELPEGVYLASFAKQLGAKFLVRGLRDAFDFHYESQIYQTNRYIEEEIETIYLMPDKDLMMVSSSWVKGLVGHSGWRQAIKPYVSEKVLFNLAMDYAYKRFKAVMKNDELYIICDIDFIWKKYYLEGMNKLKYHNVFHVLDCLESMDLYWGKDIIMEFSFWMHDIVPDVGESWAIADHMIRNADRWIKRKVENLIMATKHDKCEFNTESEEMIASIDLMPLGYSPKEFSTNFYKLYKEYRSSVYKEYLEKDGGDELDFYHKWAKGRSAFLKSMIDTNVRKYVYPHVKLRKLFEDQAISNMINEIKNIEA